MHYQGRVVKFGADYILDKHGIDGIEQAISFKKNARKPLTYGYGGATAFL